MKVALRAEFIILGFFICPVSIYRCHHLRAIASAFASSNYWYHWAFGCCAPLPMHRRKSSDSSVLVTPWASTTTMFCPKIGTDSQDKWIIWSDGPYRSVQIMCRPCLPGDGTR